MTAPFVWIAIAVVSMTAVSGCSEGPIETDGQPARPVLSAIVKPVDQRQRGFTGTIQPRYQTDRGFQILGRIVAFDVSVGDIVKAGQVLARLDPIALDLAVQSAESSLAGAQSQLSNAKGSQSRIGTLFSKQVSSQADLDVAVQARESAQAAVDQAQASLVKAREERGYASLVADMDGVVTSADGQVGQTVSPGKKVMSIARMDSPEAVVDIPASIAESIAVGTAFVIDLQADPSISITGKVREVAPEADATTRTRRVRITLDRVEEAFRLGVTVSARLTDPVSDGALELPRTALLEEAGAPRVWLVNESSGTVSTVPVKLARIDGDKAVISEGIKPNARVVVAGVLSLKEGQAVRIDEEVAQ